ncbi:MAG: hydrogenase expression protein HupH [Firmicutes bacterium]|nr:hydrogenase expression protein HupH [Bacillota bacterium]
MRSILIVIPVAGWAMTLELETYLRGVAEPDTRLTVVSLEHGPSAIECFTDVVDAQGDIMRLVQERGASCDGVLIGCFADPAVDAAREVARVPVLGIAEPSMAAAALLGHTFAVVSVGRNARAWGEIQASALGLLPRLAASVGVDIPVARLADDPQSTVDAIVDEARRCVEERGAEVIVLGCGGMVAVADLVRARLDVPVVEPLSAGLKALEMLIDLGLNHSQAGVCLPSAVR